MKILSIDLEDWFHIIGTEENSSRERWNDFESRIASSTEFLLNLLKMHDTRATFFCLGWVAEKYPNLIRQIKKDGHDIGLHTQWHRPLSELTRDELIADLKMGKANIERAIDSRVTMFRAPGFSITEENLWVFDCLAEVNIEIDSSLFLANHGHGGISKLENRGPFFIKTLSKNILEFPVEPAVLGNIKIPFAGGGYFRLIPKLILKGLIKKSNYCMFYVHPRDFDITQPVISNLSFLRKFKSYYGLSRAAYKFEYLLKQYTWCSISEALEIKSSYELQELRMR